MRWFGEIGVQVRYTTGTYIIVGRSQVEEARRKIPDAEVLPAMFAVSNLEEWASNHSRISDVRYLAEEILGWDAPFPTVEYERARVAKLRELFNRGALVMLHQPIRYIPGYKRKKPKAEAPVLGPEDAPTKTWFEVKLVDEFGDPIDGVEVVFTQGSAKEKVKTNGNGVARWKDVAGSSFASVRVADVQALRDVLRPRWGKGKPRNAPEGPGITKALLGPEAPALSLTGEKPGILVIAKPLTRVRLVGMHFDTNKCFLRESAMKGLRQVVGVYKANPTGKLLIVGHTDTTAEDAYNLELSVERAKAVRAYLQDDIAAWEAWFAESKPPKKRWGDLEVQAMIAALPCAKSVKAFQAWSNETRGTNLKVDGIAGPKTRKALIEAYMALDGTTLPKSIGAEVHGLGEWFPAKKTGDNVTAEVNRRVEIFCFDDEIDPPVPGEKGTRGEPEYPQWEAQVTTDVDVTGKGASTGPYDVIVPVERDLAESPDHVERLRLRELSGLYERELAADASDVRRVGSSNLFEFVFRDVPDGTYELLIEHGPEWVPIRSGMVIGEVADSVEEDGGRLGIPDDRAGEPWEEPMSIHHCVR
jgi:outer membrane protein OmpA-like peptidoglycan-associated protein